MAAWMTPRTGGNLLAHSSNTCYDSRCELDALYSNRNEFKRNIGEIAQKWSHIESCFSHNAYIDEPTEHDDAVTVKSLKIWAVSQARAQGFPNID